MRACEFRQKGVHGGNDSNGKLFTFGLLDVETDAHEGIVAKRYILDLPWVQSKFGVDDGYIFDGNHVVRKVFLLNLYQMEVEASVNQNLDNPVQRIFLIFIFKFIMKDDENACGREYLHV